MSLCKYKDIFGAPNTGIHSYRVFNIAIVDFSLTIIVAIIIAYIFDINVFISIFSLLLLGIVMHRIFCVRTTIDKLIY